jgi:hypothetical protein
VQVGTAATAREAQALANATTMRCSRDCTTSKSSVVRDRAQLDEINRTRAITIAQVVSRIFRTFGLAERHPALAHAVMAPLI